VRSLTFSIFVHREFAHFAEDNIKSQGKVVQNLLSGKECGNTSHVLMTAKKGFTRLRAAYIVTAGGDYFLGFPGEVDIWNTVPKNTCRFF
jgi:glucosamine 6-phosphate synthetase-like amidotransferase/phosphosugar isomerase protein